MKQVNFRMFSALLWMFLFAFTVQAQNAITGTVKGDDGDPLIGASIVIQGTTTGTITDIDGNFELNVSQALPLVLEVSYTGYSPTEVEVGSYGSIDVVLTAGIFIGEEVVISASRKREKVQEAPASISVLGERQLETSAQATDAVRNLVNVPGVQIQQQSAARINIEMRGSASLFSTGVFPIMDYRSLVGPGIGTFQSDGVGLSNIDLARIEVVRGPGSALYGPGVSAGVVHFITKNPIDYPGTTVEVFGGELSTFGAAVRHAGRSENRKFGYKINAQYRRGDEFTLDPVEDAEQIAKMQTTISQPLLTAEGFVDVTKPGEVLLTESDLDPDGDGNPMQDDWNNAAVNATFEFRPQDDLSIFLSGGYNEASAVFYNNQGEGLSQVSEIWTQARVQKGGLFAQIFYVDNDGGTKERPTFLYQTGLRTPVARKQLEGQVQYNFGLDFLNSDFTTGIDYRSAISDTEGLVYGRNEDDDDYSIIGAYLQGKFELGDKLDLVLAGCFDQYNFLDDNSFSPRAALVYKPDPKHTFRATYNQAYIPPSALEMNIDFPVAVVVPGLFDIWLAGQNEIHSYDNPMIDVTAPGVPDLPWGTPGLPLAIPYALTVEPVLEGVLPILAGDPNTAPLVPIIQAYFADPANAPTGTTGTFAPYNIFNGEPITDLVPTDPARLSTINSFEIGYKGLIADKLSVMVDWYYIERTGFYQFTAVGPTIALANPDIPTDLGNAVAAGLTPYLIANAGLDEATAAGLAGLIGGGFNQAGVAVDEQLSPLYSIFGAVESDRVPADDGIVHVPAGYQTFADESFDYWGMDIGLEYYFNSDFSAFFNYSFLSQNRWTPGEDNDDGLPFLWTINAPKNKYRVGVNYIPADGIRGSVSFQHDDSFFANFGQFSGDTDVKDLVDLSIGYKFDNGLAIDLSGQNIFNNEYRAFPNFPKIGRRTLAKLTYTFGDKK